MSLEAAGMMQSLVGRITRQQTDIGAIYL